MNRRWPVAALLVIGALMLLGAAHVNGFGAAMPFSSAYRSEYEDLVTLCGICTLAGVWAVTRLLDRRWIWTCLGITLGVALAAIAVYVPYHRHHGPLLVPDGFRGHLERVTPFHEQLAVPGFVTLGFAGAALALALLTSARRGGARPQNVMTTDGAEKLAGPW